MADEHDADELLTIDEVAALTRLTKPHLASMRFARRGPTFLKPSPRKVLYRRGDVEQWLEAITYNITTNGGRK